MSQRENRKIILGLNLYRRPYIWRALMTTDKIGSG